MVIRTRPVHRAGSRAVVRGWLSGGSFFFFAKPLRLYPRHLAVPFFPIKSRPTVARAIKSQPIKGHDLHSDDPEVPLGTSALPFGKCRNLTSGSLDCRVVACIASGELCAKSLRDRIALVKGDLASAPQLNLIFGRPKTDFNSTLLFPQLAPFGRARIGEKDQLSFCAIHRPQDHDPKRWKAAATLAGNPRGLPCGVLPFGRLFELFPKIEAQNLLQ